MITRFINPITQFGKTDYELIILDGEEIVHRQPCSFDQDVSDSELKNFADKVISQFEASQEEEAKSEPEEVAAEVSIPELIIEKIEELIVPPKVLIDTPGEVAIPVPEEAVIPPPEAIINTPLESTPTVDIPEETTTSTPEGATETPPEPTIETPEEVIVIPPEGDATTTVSSEPIIIDQPAE